MATQYDGSVNIDTKLHTVGFNQGMKKVEATAQKSLGSVARNIAKSMGSVITNVIGGFLKLVRNIGIGLIGLIGIAIAFGQRMIDSIQQNIDAESMLYKQTQLLREQYFRLQASILSIFSTLLVAALPTIIKIVDWLVRMLDIVNQVIAALTGQTTVQRVIASSVKDTADNSGKAAKNTEKMKKEAKGALAAFDQIDVLAQKAAEDTGTDTAGAGGFQFEEVPIDQKWLTFADQIKSTFLNAIQAIKDAWARFVEIWNAFWSSPIGQLITALWKNFIDTWKKILINTIETLQEIKAGIERVLTGISQFITGIITGDWRLAWEGLKNIVGGVFDIITAWIRGSIENWLLLFEGWKNQIKLVFDFVLANIVRPVLVAIAILFSGAINTIKSAWIDFSNWFQRIVIDPLRDRFSTALDFIRNKFASVFDSVRGIVRGAFNGIIDSINGILNRVTNAINSMAANVNQLSFLTGIRIPTVVTPHIPHLATGAVIPPNSQFLAVLGDQRSGENIEAPESLIRQIVREETGKMQADISIRFEGSLAQLVRELKPVIDRENVRVGGSLIKSGVTAR